MLAIFISGCAPEPGDAEISVVNAASIGEPSDVLRQLSPERSQMGSDSLLDTEGGVACSIFSGASGRTNARNYIEVVYELPERPFDFERLHLAGWAYCPEVMRALGYFTPARLTPSDPMWSFEPVEDVDEVSGRVHVMNTLKSRMVESGLFDTSAWDHERLFIFATLSCEHAEPYDVWIAEYDTRVPINLPSGLTDAEVLERINLQAEISREIFCQQSG